MRTNLWKVSTVARLGVVAATAAALTVACAKPQGSAKVKLSPEQKIDAVLKAKLGDTYDPRSDDNVQMALLLEGSSATIESVEDPNTKTKTHNVKASFLVKGVNDAIEASGSFTDDKLNDMQMATAVGNYFVKGACLTAKCEMVLVVLGEQLQANKVRAVSVLFQRGTETKTDEKTKKSATTKTANGEMSIYWSAPTAKTPEAFTTTGTKASVKQAMDKHVKGGTAPGTTATATQEELIAQHVQAVADDERAQAQALMKAQAATAPAAPTTTAPATAAPAAPTVSAPATAAPAAPTAAAPATAVPAAPTASAPAAGTVPPPPVGQTLTPEEQHANAVADEERAQAQALIQSMGQGAAPAQ